MSDFLPPDESEAGPDQFYALPGTVEGTERAYLGTLMMLQPHHARPRVEVPDSALSPLGRHIRQALREAWPNQRHGETAEALGRILPGMPPHARCVAIVDCIVQARPAGEIDSVASHLLDLLSRRGVSAAIGQMPASQPAPSRSYKLEYPPEGRKRGEPPSPPMIQG